MSRRKRFTRNLGRTLGAPLPPRMTIEWVRFEHEHEHEPFGVFWYLPEAMSRLCPKDGERAEDLRKWFHQNLDAPDDATLERFWFRSEAIEHIERARILAHLV